jgi:hypothetical protein
MRYMFEDNTIVESAGGLEKNVVLQLVLPRDNITYTSEELLVIFKKIKSHINPKIQL